MLAFHGSARCSGAMALITAFETLWFDPAIARGVLGHLAANQADDERRGRRCRARQDPARDPPRRNGGAGRGAVPPLLRQHRFDAAVRHAGRRLFPAHSRSRHHAGLWPNIEAALTWMDEAWRPRRRRLLGIWPAQRQGPDQPGLEGQLRFHFHADGTLAIGPIALVEVQAYAYAALGGAARIAQALGPSLRAP